MAGIVQQCELPASKPLASLVNRSSSSPAARLLTAVPPFAGGHPIASLIAMRAARLVACVAALMLLLALVAPAAAIKQSKLTRKLTQQPEAKQQLPQSFLATAESAAAEADESNEIVQSLKQLLQEKKVQRRSDSSSSSSSEPSGAAC